MMSTLAVRAACAPAQSLVFVWCCCVAIPGVAKEAEAPWERDAGAKRLKKQRSLVQEKKSTVGMADGAGFAARTAV